MQHIYEAELLECLAAQVLRDVQVSLRIGRDVVRRNKLSGVASQPSDGAEFGKRLAIQDQNLILSLIGHIEVLLAGDRGERQGRHLPGSLFTRTHDESFFEQLAVDPKNL